jgi:nicotinate-nucleotide--dimethylbenzimidazole phosphoribosyltransferase
MIHAPTIPSIDDPQLAQTLRDRLDHLTKPAGSLGRIEALALQIGLIQRSPRPRLARPQVFVFAADHGIAAQGVSAYPADVTGQMVENFLAGGAAISVLARQHGLAMTVVDAGVRRDFAPRTGLIVRKIAAGTADSSRGPAMTGAQCAQALGAGAAVVAAAPGNAVLLGEMGIGNTSAASLLMARLTGEDIAHCTGRGTGLDDAGVAHKTALLGDVLRRHEAAREPLEALAAFGGFEIAMMVGAALQAAREWRLVVVDGFISGAAILVAAALEPHLPAYCVYSHRSEESAHARMLAHLGAQPLLDLGLRLGEGSGAALAWPLIDSAWRLLDGMASFDSAGVSTSNASTTSGGDEVGEGPSA